MMFAERTDVGAAFGSAQFNGAGYTLTATLAPGTYDIAVYLHSSVSRTFDAAQAVRVTVR